MARASRLHIASAFTGWRRVLVGAVLLAFALQSYVVQTHVHFAHYAARPAAAAQKSGHGKAPANDEPANCPLCQEFVHTGQFIAPTAQALLPPTLAISTIALVDLAFAFIHAPSHDWRGRAPPSV
ncbi:MAG TPA: hypothetical protein VN154_04365 [Rhizomicrobium sp.]|nr:hypothetical protein [Rhizomicrobium sp.]